MNGPIHLAVPGDIETRSGGYGYDRRMMAELGRLGHETRLLALPDLLPEAKPQALAEVRARLAALPDRAVALVDGLAFGVMPEIAEEQAGRLRLVALVHHPLALETGLAPEAAERLRVSERRALAAARAVVVTSPATRDILAAGYGVATNRIAVIVPGTDPAPAGAAAGEGREGPPLILSLGSLTPRKGHDVLIDALGMVADLDWHCRIVGSDRLDPGTADALRERAVRAGLGLRVDLPGAVDDPVPHLAAATLFALASRYEGYGMAFAEAMAHGLPIVACRAGAVTDVVPPEAGLLVPPDDPDAFAEALRRLLTDRALRERMAGASRAAGALLPSWPAQAALLARVLEAAA